LKLNQKTIYTFGDEWVQEVAGSSLVSYISIYNLSNSIYSVYKKQVLISSKRWS